MATRPTPAGPAARPWRRLAPAGGLLALALAASAGPLADPTRPPQGLGDGPQRSARGPSTLRALAPAAPPVAPALLPLPQLQSLQLPAQGPALALVEGRLVRVGDTVAGRQVLDIDHQGLLLRGSTGPERLWLLGGTPKQAPGSIVTTRSARFEPADPVAPADAAPPTGPLRTAQGDPTRALPTRAATTGPLSLAGKNAP